MQRNRAAFFEIFQNLCLFRMVLERLANNSQSQVATAVESSLILTLVSTENISEMKKEPSHMSSTLQQISKRGTL